MLLRRSVEVVMGISAAALVLAVLLPALIRLHFIVPGDLAGSVLAVAVIVAAVSAVLLRKRH